MSILILYICSLTLNSLASQPTSRVQPVEHCLTACQMCTNSSHSSFVQRLTGEGLVVHASEKHLSNRQVSKQGGSIQFEGGAQKIKWVR